MAEDKKKTVTDSDTIHSAKIGDQMSFAASEAYKMLRTNLMFSFSDTECKVIGITSSVKSEGKSTTSMNLAYTLGEQGYRVLLIEGDMRMPGISKQLGLDPVPGMSNLLSGMTNKVADVLHYKALGSADFISAGETVPNPAELLGSNRMQATLDGLQKVYDYIIIDLAPVTVVSDPLVVSKYLKGMVLVVRHELADQRHLAEAVRMLKFANVRILGFVYNAYSGNSGSYSKKYYKKYGYGYGYGHGEKSGKASKKEEKNND